MNPICWLFGHPMMTRQFGGGRVWTRCELCGWNSPGLGREKGGRRPRKVKYQTVAEREVTQGKVVDMKKRRTA